MSEAEQTTVCSIDHSVDDICESARADFRLQKTRDEMVNKIEIENAFFGNR